MKKASFSLLVIAFLNSPFSMAQVISPSAMELQFSYSASFSVPLEQRESPTELAQFHASHLFGVFQSPRFVKAFGLNHSLVGGIGAPKEQTEIRIISAKRGAGGYEISYVNRGRMLVHNQVAKALLQARQLEVPLPNDPYAIYNESCTDHHYNGFGDFWYFWDPFRPGCEALSREPQSKMVQIKISAPPNRKMEQSPRLDLLRGNNGNGSLFSIYVVHGYSESATDRYDEGRINYEEFNQQLRTWGFAETKKYSGTSRPLSVFKRDLRLATGQVIQVEIKHLLVETAAESRGVSFARFFKQAVAEADVIVYGGHSGLGGNLDIRTLEGKAGAFVFPPNKKQIFFFDSCSSYSYYLDMFSAEKRRSKIDVITNGLSSYFNVSGAVLKGLFNVLLDAKIQDASWLDILGYMEKPLGGGSFLLNVGGI